MPMSDWLDRHHGYKPDPEWITPTSGVVSALGLILQAFTEEKDTVVVFSPAYHAFKKIIDANNRQIHNQPMINEQGQYKMDFDGLRKILVVADSAGVDGDKYHMLTPRYITQAERNIDELEAVIHKMKGQVH